MDQTILLFCSPRPSTSASPWVMSTSNSKAWEGQGRPGNRKARADESVCREQGNPLLALSKGNMERKSEAASSPLLPHFHGTQNTLRGDVIARHFPHQLKKLFQAPSPTYFSKAVICGLTTLFTALVSNPGISLSVHPLSVHDWSSPFIFWGINLSKFPPCAFPFSPLIKAGSQLFDSLP